MSNVARIADNGGIVGLGEDLVVCCGHDWIEFSPHENLTGKNGSWTVPEARELADLMIARWAAFKQILEKK